MSRAASFHVTTARAWLLSLYILLAFNGRKEEIDFRVVIKGVRALINYSPHVYGAILLLVSLPQWQFCTTEFAWARPVWSFVDCLAWWDFGRSRHFMPIYLSFWYFDITAWHQSLILPQMPRPGVKLSRMSLTITATTIYFQYHATARLRHASSYYRMLPFIWLAHVPLDKKDSTATYSV